MGQEVNQELKQLQEQLADVLEQMIAVCKRHNIDYYMAWGSCLGAVRHNNFIPWDDDIDVYIPYSQLDKFKEYCLKELPKDYFYQDMETDPNYFLVYPKVRKTSTTSMNKKDSDIPMNWGIGIDIFPLFDAQLPEKTEKIQKRVTLLRRMGYFFPVVSLVIVMRMSIQGLGYSARAMFGGILEMFARSFVAMVFVPMFKFDAITWTDQAAWVVAAVYLGYTSYAVMKHVEQQIQNDSLN